jgi:pilus assembly protein Flp/PilA
MAWKRGSTAHAARKHVSTLSAGLPPSGGSRGSHDELRSLLETTSMQSPVAVAALKSLAETGTDRFRRSEDGQDLLEYGLLAALIAIIAIGAVSTLGNTIQQVFWSTIASSF